MALSEGSRDVNGTEVLEGKSEVLSRRKRFIIFPEGSSFQLVFCTTYPMLTMIGDIFLYGNTAALAWELPQDPYSPFNHRADPLHRRVDSKVIYYTNDDGRILYKRPYKRKPIVNPAFAKRSVDSANTDQIVKSVENFKIDRKQMHGSKNNRWFLNSSGPSDRLHRSSRLSLYQKIETMLRGLGTDGKQCLLKTLCVIGKTNNDPQGTFLQEILRAVFSLPKGATEEVYREYEAAHYASESCDALFPECNEAPLESNSPILSY
ncbi:hypothetical protein O3G_MSEX006931 [Manduca sexta]|uniref:Uncharacterized protein n=2 Tax=Manduca sexta TaxID=7130 RepID=A0A921Z495_MANSE|nr:hypothetical protein O3G_MSEX006931 [Manduca sexta]